MDQLKLKRTESYGQSGKFSLVDRLGGFLSLYMINKHIHALGHKSMRLLDVGCGYHARILAELAPDIASGMGIDIAISDQAKSIPKLTFIEGPIESSIKTLGNNSIDLVLLISVLEHLEDPLYCLNECRRILDTRGILLINVPTWKGKFFLEQSAFHFQLSSSMEMDDHKMYYDKKDIWPLLVKAGFRPSGIKMTYHKFGLNLFVSCQKQ